MTGKRSFIIMGKLFVFFLLVIITSCSTGRSRIERIELISTYNGNVISYSMIDQHGNAKSILNSTAKTEYKSKVPKALIDSIFMLTKKAREADFRFVKSIDKGIYCGPSYRVKIKFNNSDVLYLAFVDSGLEKENQKFKIFMHLFNIIETAPVNRSPLSAEEKLRTERSCREFSAFKKQQDSISLQKRKLEGDTTGKKTHVFWQ